MARKKKLKVDEKLNNKIELFIKNISSDMYFKSELISDSMSFDWVTEIAFACPYIDNTIRNPKLSLIKEEDVVKIEKARKISVASVKDLSKHTQFIDKVDKVTNEVEPSKILIERYEDTFNIYENRFIYTLVNNMMRFVSRKESELNKFQSKKDQFIEYSGETFTDDEKINIELKINSKAIPKGKSNDDFEDEIDIVKKKVKKIKDYIASWKKSDMIQALEKAHVSFVTSPIKKTNIILKNPNFQIAMKLWTYIQTYDFQENSTSKDGLDTSGNDILKNILDDSFLMDFYVLDSISHLKREQKEKLAKYAIIMIHQQIKRTVSLLINSGMDITDEEIVSIISNEIKSEKLRRVIGTNDVKKKFKDAMDEYLERIQN